MTEGIHYAKKLESAVLGACLLEKTAIGRAYGIIEAESFYTDDNKKVFAYLLDMFDRGAKIDCITVWLEMTAKGEILHAGNVAWYLSTLTNDVVSTAHLEYHCHIIKEMWRKRELERITHEGIDEHEDSRSQIAKINSRINEIKGNDYRKDWYTMEDLMVGLIEHQADIKSGKMPMVTSGFKTIDAINGGFYPGQMIVIGARPSMGKSALVGGMAIAMAKSGKSIGVISLEMDNNQIAGRLASLETEIDFKTIYRNLFDDEKQQQRFFETVSSKTANLPIYVSDKTKVDVNEIKAKASKLKAFRGCDCIIVDYLQLIETTVSNKNYNREQEVSKISRGLKLMAMEMEIPVIVVCQLNRETTKRHAKDRYPKESDLRESGAIEQDADAIIMLHRDFKAGYLEDENGRSTENEADLLGVKWRNGAVFHLKLDFDGPIMKFKERAFQPNQLTWQPVSVLPEEKEDKPF